MITTKKDIGYCFDNGVQQNWRWLLIVCDTFDHEDYPFYINKIDNFWKTFYSIHNKNMQRVMEVYDLSKDKEEQLNEHKCWNVPLLDK